MIRDQEGRQGYGPRQKNMAPLVKFASLPAKYAPKRKLIDFALPAWRTKLGEFVDQDLMSFINGLYQDKVFRTQKEFNDAYDHGVAELLNWTNKPMVLSAEDVESLEATHKNGGFDFVDPARLDKLLAKLKTHLETGEKGIFVY